MNLGPGPVPPASAIDGAGAGGISPWPILPHDRQVMGTALQCSQLLGWFTPTPTNRVSSTLLPSQGARSVFLGAATHKGRVSSLAHHRRPVQGERKASVPHLHHHTLDQVVWPVLPHLYPQNYLSPMHLPTGSALLWGPGEEQWLLSWVLQLISCLIGVKICILNTIRSCTDLRKW